MSHNIVYSIVLLISQPQQAPKRKKEKNGENSGPLMLLPVNRRNGNRLQRQNLPYITEEQT